MRRNTRNHLKEETALLREVLGNTDGVASMTRLEISFNVCELKSKQQQPQLYMRSIKL